MLLQLAYSGDCTRVDKTQPDTYSGDGARVDTTRHGTQPGICAQFM